MKTIEDALEQVGETEDPDTAFGRLFADQMTPEVFREHLHAIRQIPVELVPKLVECREMFPTDAFRSCFPNAVTRDAFRSAVAAMRKSEPTLDETTKAESASESESEGESEPAE